MNVTADRLPAVVRHLARAVMAPMSLAGRVRHWIKAASLVDKFASHGVDVRFDPDGIYTFASIHLGSHVDLGYRPILIAARSQIRIGNNVIFGPQVIIRGGNHRFDIPGIPTRDVTNEMKRPEDDPGVTIEDDVWVGTRAIILHGVTIGRGSVVGAGAVVTASVPPFTVVGGVPARMIRQRFDNGHAGHARGSDHASQHPSPSAGGSVCT